VGDYEQLLLLVAGELLPVRVSPSAPRARRCCPCADNPPVGDSHVTFHGRNGNSRARARGGKSLLHLVLQQFAAWKKRELAGQGD
jgi:hypothetical protein